MEVPPPNLLVYVPSLIAIAGVAVWARARGERRTLTWCVSACNLIPLPASITLHVMLASGGSTVAQVAGSGWTGELYSLWGSLYVLSILAIPAAIIAMFSILLALPILRLTKDDRRPLAPAFILAGATALHLWAALVVWIFPNFPDA